MVQLLYDCRSYGACRVRTHTVIPNANGIPRAPFSRAAYSALLCTRFSHTFRNPRRGYASICHSYVPTITTVSCNVAAISGLFGIAEQFEYTRNNLNLHAGGISCKKKKRKEKKERDSFRVAALAAAGIAARVRRTAMFPLESENVLFIMPI